MNLLSSLKKPINIAIIVACCAILSGMSPLTMVYADGDTESETGETTTPEQPESPDDNNSTTNNGSNDYTEEPDRNDLSGNEGNGDNTDLPSHIVNPGSNTNNNNNPASTPNTPTSTPSTNPNSSSRNYNSTGSTTDTSQNTAQNSDGSDSIINDRDITPEHEDDIKNTTETDNGNINARDSSQSDDHEDFGSLAWIFAGVVAGIVILVGIVAFFVDKISRQRNLTELETAVQLPSAKIAKAEITKTSATKTISAKTTASVKTKSQPKAKTAIAVKDKD